MNIPNYDNNSTQNNFIQILKYMPDRCFRMLICGAFGSGKTNTLIHMLLKPLIFYDKIYLYAKNQEQDKYSLLAEKLNKIACKSGISLEDILYSSNEDIISVNNMDNTLQKVIIFDDYVCEKNQDDIINYFIQGRHKNCCVIYLSQSYYKTPKDIRLNGSHYIFFESPSKRETDQMCNEQNVNKNIYNFAFKKEYDFVYLDKPRKLIKIIFYGEI